MEASSKEGVLNFVSQLNDEMSEQEIMEMIYAIPKKSPDEERTPGLKAKQRAVFKDLYHLIISNDRGPALSTLVKAVGTDKVRELIAPLEKTENKSFDSYSDEGER